MSGRLDDDLLVRFEDYAVRVLNVADALDRNGVYRRVVDQLAGSGTSPGAHMHEADEALSRADFVRILGGAAKELRETRFWLRVATRKRWLSSTRLGPLMDETEQLLRIVKAMKVRTEKNTKGR